MKSFTVFAVVAAFAYIAVLHQAGASTLKTDYSQLTNFEKIHFQLSHPELYKKWISNRGNALGAPLEDDILEPYIDLLAFDLPTLALQVSNWEDRILPSYRHVYTFYFCYLGICAGHQTQSDYKEPELKGANLTRLSTKINATHLQIDFLIPDLEIINEKYTAIQEDLVDLGDIEISRGSTFIIKNYSLKLSANLEHVPDVGLQLSNVALDFTIDSCLSRIENQTHIYPDGTVEELDGWENELKEFLDFGWAEVGAEVNVELEIWLNCFLSNGRNGNAECDELLNDPKEAGNFAQLLQSTGLGISRARENEELAKNPVRESNSDKFRLLPELPVLTIDSVLLDLPTLLLQVGKLYGGDNEHTFSSYPMYYEYDRKVCDSGVCRDVHEHMTLPYFVLGGLPENRVQIDFQPTNFTYSLKVPNAYLKSDTYQLEITDLDSRNREVYLGLELTVKNSAFAISGDYEFIEGVGIQVSNVGITLLLGEVQMRVPTYYTVENGVGSEIQEYKNDIAPQFMEIWRAIDEDGVSFETKYENYVQNEINSILSNGQPLTKLFG